MSIKPIIIYIEGNIGSGKSTFARQFSDLLHKFKKNNQYISVIQEPVDDWIQTMDTDGKNVLEKFYEDIDRWSFTFQMNSFISRSKKIQDEIEKYTKQHSDVNNGNNNQLILFVERSIYTDRHVFATNCYENGKMTKMEYDIYCKWNDWLSEQFDLRPTGYVYLKCDPEINDKRIIKRSRGGEHGIPLQYLKQIHDKHETWLTEEFHCSTIPLLTLDATENFLEENIMNEFAERVFDFVNTINDNSSDNAKGN